MSKSEVKIYHGAIVCKESRIKGDVTIGSMTIVHPAATIIAEAGPIIIGDGNIVEEKVIIINRLPKTCNAVSEEVKVLNIGNNNVFEVGCTVECTRIGDNNVLESKSYVGPGIEVGRNSVIGAGCKLTIPECLPDNTLIFGTDFTRKALSDKPVALNLQRDFLFKVLPNYHHLKKSKKLTDSSK